MSIQAVGWVLSQKAEDLPGTARLVLISLANHANHVTGHSFNSIELIAKEAGCSERTASRYIYALSRNGFVDVRRTTRKDGKFRSNDYWIIFERISAPWQYFNRDGFGDDQKEPDANLADGEYTTEGLAEAVENPEDSPGLAYGPSATVGITQSLLQPSESQPSPTEIVDSPVPGIASTVPIGYQPQARIEEAARNKAAEEARTSKPQPVIEGSKPWQAWIAHGHKPGLVGKVDINGKVHRGWYFPSLYPPKSTGPPLPLDDCSALADELGK
jgi:hypothetical protein